MKREETVDYQVKACWHAISRMYNGEAAQHEFTMAIGHVLLIIDAEKGTPATHIGPLVGLESRSLTRMLRSLEEDGLIYRETGVADKRFVNIFLTRQGKEKREIARRTVREFNFLIRENVPPDKLAVFFEVVQQITKTVEFRRFYPSAPLAEVDLAS